MKRILFAMLLAACVPAFAQFGGFDIGKALDIGKKAVQASKDFTEEEEIQIGDAATASFLGASPLHKDANLQRYVNRVGKWLALHSDRPDLPECARVFSGKFWEISRLCRWQRHSHRRRC